MTGLGKAAISYGGRFGYTDAGDTPNTQVVIHDYASAPLIFEVRGLPAKAGGAGGGRRGDTMDAYQIGRAHV